MSGRNRIVVGLVLILGLAQAVACDEPAVLPEQGAVQSDLTRGPASMTFNLGWRIGQHVREVRDVNADRHADLIGFGIGGVWLALNEGNAFAEPRLVISNLGNSQGFTGANSVRTMADVNGDGRPDLVVFGKDSVLVSLKDTASSYSAPSVWSADYSADYEKGTGWIVDKVVLTMADVDGDRRADIVGFNDWGVYVSLALAGGGFGPRKMWFNQNLNAVHGWDVTKHPRLVADLDHDGLGDLIGFGNDGVYVSKSNGATFGDIQRASTAFAYNDGWRIGTHVRTLANVNGDQYLDIIGIGQAGVVVALGSASGFDPSGTWSGEFGGNTGWGQNQVRLIGDVDGDGLDDIVGIKDHIYLARSTGGKFETPVTVSDEFTAAKGWQVDKHPRFLADVDGDGQLELVGFFDDAVYWDRLTPVRVIPTDWSTPACTAGRLAQPATNYCEGPWQFSKRSRCVGQDVSCRQVCSTFASCSRWENGVTTTASTEATGILGSGTRNCSRRCTSLGCGPTTCDGTITQPTFACQTAATNRQIQLKTSADALVTAEPNFDSDTARSQRSTEAQEKARADATYVIITSNRTSTPGPGGTLSTWNEQWLCQLSVTTPAPVLAVNDACGCSTWSMGTCEHDCGISTTEYTMPGMQRPSGVGISDQACLTHDDMPQSTPADIQAKFQELWKTYQGTKPTTVPADTFTRAIVSRLKLIYELWGDKLINERNSTDQVHRAISLYADRPEDNPACALDIEAPVALSVCKNPAATDTRGELIRCQRLLGEHASESVASLALSDCIALLNGYIGLAPQRTEDAFCQGPRLRSVGARTVLKLEDKQLAVISSAPTTLGALPRQLWLLDSWYAASKAAEAAGTFRDPDQQRRDTSFLLGHLWDRIRANTDADARLRALTSGTTADAAETAVGLAATGSRGADQAVVSALFTVPSTIQPENVALTRPPLRGLPVLALLGDALKPLIDDLDGLAVLHDIACQFQDCRSPATNTPSRRAWTILSSLEASGLTNEVTATPHALAGWKPVFAQLAAQQPVLTRAIEQATSVAGGLASARQESDVHPLARPLWLLYKHARSLHDHFEATGMFDPTAQNLLQGSVLQDQQAHVVQVLRDRVARLSGTVSDYKAGLVAALQAQIAVMDAGAQIDNLTNQRLHKAAEMDQKAENAEKLRVGGDAEADAFASLAASFADVQRSLDQGAYVQIGNTQTFRVNGGDARFQASRAPADIAVQLIPNLAAGQMLVIQTSNTWKPTCALREQLFLKPDGLSNVGADLSQAEIGPEGYVVSWNGSTFDARSAGRSVSRESTIGASFRICEGTGPAGKVVGISAEACVYGDIHKTTSMNASSTSGGESRSSAAFSTGLRLPSTPFPEAAVGSLLVVLTDPQTGSVREVKVVHTGATSILIEQSSNAYFVVNDKMCGTPDTTHELTVNVRAMTSVTATAEAALKGMAAVLGYMRQQQDTYVAQGTLLPTQATLLRQQAAVLLQAEMDRIPELNKIHVADLPVPLLNLFDAFVSHEIVATERRIEIRAIQRSLDLDLIELRTIDDELAAGATRARLQRLIPQWMLRNLDHDQLRGSLVDVLTVSRDFLRPIFDLWYPHALDNHQGGPEISALLNADVDTSLVTLADKGRVFVNTLLDAYEDATFGAKQAGQQLPIVVVTFPRPGLDPSNAFWREADAVRARRVWDAIDRHTVAHFEITAEDFYSRNGGDAVLSCNEVTPVIKTMEMFVVRPNGDVSNTILNSVNRSFHGTAGLSQSFVTPAGPKVYELSGSPWFPGSAWQSFDVPVRYGENEAAVQTFLSSPRQQRPIGLSATGGFDFDFSILDRLPSSGQFNLNDPFPVTEVALVMELDSRAVGDRPAWVNRCK